MSLIGCLRLVGRLTGLRDEARQNVECLGAGFGVASMITFGGYAGLLTAAAAFYASWKAVHDAHPDLPV